jgi:hypothetical protein
MSENFTDSDKIIKRSNTRLFKNQRTGKSSKRDEDNEKEDSLKEQISLEDDGNEETSEFISDNSFTNTQNSRYLQEKDKFDKKRARRFPVGPPSPQSSSHPPQIVV